MSWYCEKCRKMHMSDEICPVIQVKLREHPEWITQLTNFAVVAGEYSLITSNALDTVTQGVNKLLGTNLAYEGTHQIARDIQVFRRLSEEPFARSGVFSTAEKAQTYFSRVKELAEGNSRVMGAFDSKLAGYAQEVDWLRQMEGQFGSVFKKSELLSGNAPGVDGITFNRFTGDTISQTTIKASKNPMRSYSTGIKDVQEAISKGTATGSDVIYGPQGTEAAARTAGLQNPVLEKNSYQDIRQSNERLKRKIDAGGAVTEITPQQLAKSMANGALIGAAIELTVSGITNYVRYKNGEITKEEAFRDVGASTAKGALTGAAISGISLFLPVGGIGFAAGLAIGIYISAATKNILDDIFGKGFYEQALHASGYVYGTSITLADELKKIAINHREVQENNAASRCAQNKAEEDILDLLGKLGG